MKALRLLVALAAVLVVMAVSPAVGVFGGSQLSVVGPVPKSVVFASTSSGAEAEFSFAIRNDSSVRRALHVRLVLDDGTTVRLRGRPRILIVDGQRVTLRLRYRGLHVARIGPRDVRRVVVQLTAEPAPKKAVTGTLVIALRGSRRVSPATAPVTFEPKRSAAAAPRWKNATATPATVVMNVYRWLPSPLAPSALITDAQDVSVKGLGDGPAITAGSSAATLASQLVSADTGGRGSLSVTTPDGVGLNSKDATIRIDAQELTSHGTYDAKIPLDPALESPAVTVKVLARDFVIWPLLAILAGSWVAWYQLRNQEERRPKDVLRLALKRLKELHESNQKDSESPVPYELDPFPDGGKWDICIAPETEAHQLYCRIETATMKEELDDLTEAVSSLDTRVRAWPIARVKVKYLNAACEHLPDNETADEMRKGCVSVATRSPPPADKEEANQYFAQVEAQIGAVSSWLAAQAMLDEASAYYAELVAGGNGEDDLLRRHNPTRWSADLKAARTAADLNRCGVVEGLCRDLHLLRSLALASAGQARAAAASAQTKEARFAVELAIETPTPPAVAPPIEPATKVTPSPSVSDRLLSNLKAEDRRSFLLGYGVATITYFATIYTDTYGSWIDYLTAFAAGAGATYVTNFKLLPWFRSYRPPKSA